MMFEMTQFAKTGGALTKVISLNGDGSVHSDSSECRMSSGRARRLVLPDMGELAGTIEQFEARHALGLGRLRPDLADQVRIATKQRLNGAARPGLISRTANNVIFAQGCAAPVLFDHDSKGMPAEIAERIAGLGGFEPALLTVMPALSGAARLFRASTSAGLYRSDTGERLPGSSGAHGYCVARDGADIDRFLRALHCRCWLAGLGWYTLGAAGQLLERSIVDRMVGAPERLVFEGPPTLVSPLAQDAAAREPIVHDGALLDTLAVMPPLSIAEQTRLRELRARVARALEGEAARVRERHVDEQSEKLARRTKRTVEAARRVIEKQCQGVLLPDIELQFDDERLAGKTVADVLTNPNRYVGETLADPQEGVEYGRGKAKILRRPDGSLLIHSFAHGRTVYELKIDLGMARAMLRRAPVAEVDRLFVRLALEAEVDDAEVEKLRDLAAERGGTGKRTLNNLLKAARTERANQRAKAERQRRAAERTDPRPQLPAPPEDAETLPQTEILNGILGAATDPEPPMRDITGRLTRVWVRSVPNIHGLGVERPPEMLLLTQLDLYGASELIEKYVEHVVETPVGPRTVRLGDRFVHHYLLRDDRALPVVVTAGVLPLHLAQDQEIPMIVDTNGLHRDLGLVLRIPPELANIARIEDLSDEAVAAAMRFLLDDWFGDVLTDDAGKATLVACALTIIERPVLTERPAFFVTAGKRSSGKTTALNMISQAILGTRAPAAAWSPIEEERRKALFAYLLEGLPFLVWDNIPKGSLISSPAIEKALTAEFMSDRLLGESRTGAPNATTIMAFTGNNIAPQGDLASRVLEARLSTDRPDPENRRFKHPDPIGWTRANRIPILRALYTVLLGGRERGREVPTRFKMWFKMVGARVERVMRLVERPVSFQAMFEKVETDDEETIGAAEVLSILRAQFPPHGATSAVIADQLRMLGDFLDDPWRERLRTGLEQLTGKMMPVVSATTVTLRLKTLVDAPVRVGAETLVLRYQSHHEGGGFKVEVIGVQAEATKAETVDPEGIEPDLPGML
jgi:hypothetical protein